jgi:DNA-binding response OmpR family regulator
MMPRLDGIDTTRLIRRNRTYAETIVIALSARSDEETRERMRQVGANLFMRKPFVISRLVERVEQLLVARSELS